jgi:hypothetical protein
MAGITRARRPCTHTLVNLRFVRTSLRYDFEPPSLRSNPIGITELSMRSRDSGTVFEDENKKPEVNFRLCDPAGIRTQDPYIKSVLLYQLSYGIFFEAGARFYRSSLFLVNYKVFSVIEVAKVTEDEKNAMADSKNYSPSFSFPGLLDYPRLQSDLSVPPAKS